MADGDFSIDYEDQDQYEYEHRDGTTARVSIRDRSNGGTIGVHHYDADGSRLSYFRFHIQSVDNRQIVMPDPPEEGIPGPVAHALHAGGWELGNLSRSTVEPDDSDPLEVQLLEVRDGFQAVADQEGVEVLAEYFEALARAVERGLATWVAFRAAEADGADPNEVYETINEEKAREDHPFAGTDGMMTNSEMVEGWMINAARPETERSTARHERTVALVERMRDYYTAGLDEDGAWAQANEDVPDAPHPE